MSDHWGTIITNNLYLAHDHNLEGTMNGLGFELRSASVHLGKKWNNGFELGRQYNIATHIKHSEWVKDTFRDLYPENVDGINGPKDGWYSATVSRFRLGFVSSTSLNDH